MTTEQLLAECRIYAPNLQLQRVYDANYGTVYQASYTLYGKPYVLSEVAAPSICTPMVQKQRILMSCLRQLRGEGV